MKLTEGMDVGRTSTPLLNGDLLNNGNPHKNEEPILPDLPVEDSLKHSSCKVSNGLPMAENMPNGNLSPTSPSDDTFDVERIGVEVESYGELNSPVSPGHQSQEEFNSNHGQKNENSVDSVKDKKGGAEEYLNDKCGSDSEVVHDSSLLSEEFQLRLSEDDDHNEEPSHSSETVFPVITSVCSTEEGVSQHSNGSDEIGEDKSGSEHLGEIKSTSDLVKDDALHVESAKEDDQSQPAVCSDEERAKDLCSNEDTVKNKTTVEDLSEETSIQGHSHSGQNKRPFEFTHQEPRNDVQMTIEEDKLLEGNDQAGSETLPHATSSLSIEDKMEADLEAEMEAEIAAETDAAHARLLKQRGDEKSEGLPETVKIKQEVLLGTIEKEEGIKSSKPETEGDDCVKIKLELKEELIEDEVDFQLKVELEETSVSMKCLQYQEDFVKLESKQFIPDSLVKSEDGEPSYLMKLSEVKTEVPIKCEKDSKEIPFINNEALPLGLSESVKTVTPTIHTSSVVPEDKRVHCQTSINNFNTLKEDGNASKSQIEGIDKQFPQDSHLPKTSVSEKSPVCSLKEDSLNDEIQSTAEGGIVQSNETSMSDKNVQEQSNYDQSVATISEVSSRDSNNKAEDGLSDNTVSKVTSSSSKVIGTVCEKRINDNLSNITLSEDNPTHKEAEVNLSDVTSSEVIAAVSEEKAEHNSYHANLSADSVDSKETVKDNPSDALSSNDRLDASQGKERGEDEPPSDILPERSMTEISDREVLKSAVSKFFEMQGKELSENEINISEKTNSDKSETNKPSKIPVKGDEVFENDKSSMVKQKETQISETGLSCSPEGKDSKVFKNDCSSNPVNEEKEVPSTTIQRMPADVNSERSGADHPNLANSSKSEIIEDKISKCELTSGLLKEVKLSQAEDAVAGQPNEITIQSCSPVPSTENLLQELSEQSKEKSDRDSSSPDDSVNEELFSNKGEKSPECRSVTLEKNFESPDVDLSDTSSRDDNDDYSGNDNYCDIPCDNEIMNSEDDTDAEDKSDSDSNRMLSRNRESSEFPDGNISISPTFCESAMDTSPADHMDSQDFSSSSSANRNSQGSILFSARKRTLSPSDDDSWDSCRTKKINGFSGKISTTIGQDGGLKRHGELNYELDPKKQRFNEKNGSSTTNCDLVNSEGCEEEQSSSAKQSSSTGNHKSMKMPGFSLIRSFHKEDFKSMSRSDLEELVLLKICEAITERNIAGELRRKCEVLEQRQEKEAEKFIKLRKQMGELSIVMKKYLENQNLNTPAPPIRVTRSVGLQVCQTISPHLPTPTRYLTHQPLPYFMKEQNIGPYRSVPRTPPRPNVVSDTQKTPVKVTKASTPSPRPSSNIITSVDPPVLVPPSCNTPTLVPISSRSSVTPPRVPMPPLQQIPSVRPRPNTSISISTPPPQMSPRPAQLSSVRLVSPQTKNPPVPAKKDVEVIDIVEILDKDNPKNKKAQISAEQLIHQQKQAANAVVQSLSGNSGLTVRLLPPASQSYPQVVVPQRFIANTTPQGVNGMRGNLKIVMKSNSGNLVIPMQSNLGSVSVSSSVVHIPSTQTAVQQIFTNANSGIRTNTVATARQSLPAHPAPLPAVPLPQTTNPAWKQLPPRPSLKCQLQNNGIVLSWNMSLSSIFADIENYQIYAYQENTAPPNPSLWKKVGDVKALPLPMACTLTQFMPGHRYHFTVRAVDTHGRVGPFSQQSSIRLGD